jgi:hypothetical protein
VRTGYLFFCPLIFFFDCSEKNGIDVKQLGLVSYRWLEFEKKGMTRRIDLPCFFQNRPLDGVAKCRLSMAKIFRTLSRFSIAQNYANKR